MIEADGLRLILADRAAVAILAELFQIARPTEKGAPVIDLGNSALKIYLADDPCDMRIRFRDTAKINSPLRRA